MICDVLYAAPAESVLDADGNVLEQSQVIRDVLQDGICITCMIPGDSKFIKKREKTVELVDDGYIMDEAQPDAGISAPVDEPAGDPGDTPHDDDGGDTKDAEEKAKAKAKDDEANEEAMDRMRLKAATEMTVIAEEDVDLHRPGTARGYISGI